MMPDNKEEDLTTLEGKIVKIGKNLGAIQTNLHQVIKSIKTMESSK